MKKLILISGLVLLTFVLAACSSNELLNTTWQWNSLTETEPSSQSVVPNPEKYTIVFGEEDHFNATVDCNLVSGAYELKGKELHIMPGPSTRAECGPDSLDDMFISLLSQVTGYEMDGETLVLIVGGGTAKMFFENAGPAE
jgi:heat shock protein HslJ